MNDLKIKNKEPLITVAIPVYNRSDLFRIALESVLAQTYFNIDILVIDDFSKEDIASIVFAYKDSRLRFIRNSKNLGLVPNWNECLKHAKGTIINILHSDDILYEYACEKVADWFLKHPDLGIVYSGRSNIKNSYIPPEFAAKIIMEKDYIIPSVFIAKKAVLECGFYSEDLKYSADMEYFPRIASKFPVVCIDPPIALNRNHSKRYQMKTWANPDFLKQLQEVRLRGWQHAEIDKEIIREKVYNDIISGCLSIFLFLLIWGKSYKEYKLARLYFRTRTAYLRKLYGNNFRELLYIKKYYYFSFLPQGYKIATKLAKIKMIFKKFIVRGGNRIRNKLIKFKIRHYRDIEGWLSVREAIALYHFASLLPAGSTIIEIGSWKGKSTYCLARGLRRSGRVMAIDPFDASGEEGSTENYQQKKGQYPLLNQFTEQMSRLGIINKIKILNGCSNEFVGLIPKINLLFIDGDHSREGADFDFLNYSPFLVTGGYLLLHDFDASRKDLGPTWVFENRIIPDQTYQFIDLIDRLCIVKKL